MTKLQTMLVSGLVGAVTILLGVAAAVVVEQHKSRSVYSCVPGPGELCASDQFYSDFKHWKEIRAAVGKRSASAAVREFQDEQDMADGMAARLVKQIPAGYDWDEAKGRFVLKPEQSAPPAQKK